MPAETPTLAETIFKTAVSHTTTYFFVGALAYVAFDYAARYSDPSIAGYLRPTSDLLVMAGPLFQPLRGMLFGVLLYALREPFFHRRNGWALLWMALVILGILGPFESAPGSLEGLIYTRIPIAFHLTSLPEVLVQSLALSGLVFFWTSHPENKWLSWVLGVAFCLILFLSAIGLIVGLA